MVPGVLSNVIPFLRAKPERGLICASYPSGKAMNSPVGMSLRSIGANVSGSSNEARKSIPALCIVAYSGSG